MFASTLILLGSLKLKIYLIDCQFSRCHFCKIITSNFIPQTSDLRPQPSALIPQTSSLRPQTSNLNLQPSDLRLQTSSLRLQTSDLKPQTSNFRPQTSDFKLQTSYNMLVLQIRLYPQFKLMPLTCPSGILLQERIQLSRPRSV